MKRLAFLLPSIVLMFLAPSVGAAANIRVVTTIPDLADMARHIGGDLLDVKSLATGVENIHAVPMKPSFVPLLNRVDILLLMGLEMEHAFLPGLLEVAQNPKISRGAPGYIDCSAYIAPLEVPNRIDRSLGDQHPMGNPHFNLDPVRGKEMARAIADGLARSYPQYESTFKRHLEAYLATLDAAIARWEGEAGPLRGVKFVSYHPDMTYFAERFGMQAVGTIEIRAGIDPTPTHIVQLEETMRRDGVKLVIRELVYPANLAQTVAQHVGATLVELPYMVGGVPDAKDYISLIDYNVRTMLKAVTTKAAQGG